MPSARAAFLKTQMKRIKPISTAAGIRACRAMQAQYGTLMAVSQLTADAFKNIPFPDFEACMITPLNMPKPGRAILYLHGGGYTAGNLAYARGFGAVLAAGTGWRVFSVAYRLAPEEPFPAALEDALTAYDYLLEQGYTPENIVFAGESAGGGLIYALCHRLRQLGRAFPKAMVGISPWTDLTCSGASYTENADCDPSLSLETLKYYAWLYAPGRETDPLVSPLYGTFTGFPPSLLFCGTDELLRSDVNGLHEELLRASCRSELIEGEGMWHVYVLFPTPESEDAIKRIRSFLEEMEA